MLVVADVVVHASFQASKVSARELALSTATCKFAKQYNGLSTFICLIFQIKANDFFITTGIFKNNIWKTS